MSLFDTLRDALSQLLSTILPPEARAASLEIVGTQATVRVYLHGGGGGGIERWRALDEAIAPLVTRHLPSAAWRVVVQAVRRDRPQPLDVFGTVVWIEDGTSIASVDGKPVVRRGTPTDLGAEGRA